MQEKSSFAYIILGSVLRIFRHDIAEILLKVVLNTKIQIHSRITHLRSYLTGKFYMLARILYFTISVWYGGRV
jgi:hypothetical protein